MLFCMSPDPAMLPTHGPDSKYDIVLEGVRHRGNLTFTPDSDSVMKVDIPTTHMYFFTFGNAYMYPCTCTL